MAAFRNLVVALQTGDVVETHTQAQTATNVFDLGQGYAG